MEKTIDRLLKIDLPKGRSAFLWEFVEGVREMGAYSDGFQPLIPIQSGHLFRLIPASHSFEHSNHP